MAGKRRHLTVDDLQRMQEDGPSRKRPRAQYILEDGDDSDSDVEVSQQQTRPEESGAESDETNSYGLDNRMPETDDHIDDDEGDEPDVDSGGPSTLSRVSFKPRARETLAVPRKPLTVSPTQLASFASLGISSAILNALFKMSIRAPTEIQTACIPPLLQGEYIA